MRFATGVPTTDDIVHNKLVPYTGCESVEILSTNRTLLPLASIVATSAMSDDPASDVVSDSGITWCSAEEFSDGPAPYIMFSFTERVTLTHMRAHGGSGSQLAYVTRFSLDYKEIDGQSFNQYTLLTNEQAVSIHTHNSCVYFSSLPVCSVILV